jgi:HAE1 family hydrophobic/amphiphilic exporter-1
VIIYLFLQNWRATLIPAIAIPVSLIGTFIFIKLLNFNINTLTLFGLTLATGLVVDDAIVVVEDVTRRIQEKGETPVKAAIAAMNELQGAVIASSMVLIAVFVPVAFFPGTTGQLYKQFALTIAFSITVSTFNALTLSPTLAAFLLKQEPACVATFLSFFIVPILYIVVNTIEKRLKLDVHDSQTINIAESSLVNDYSSHKDSLEKPQEDSKSI